MILDEIRYRVENNDLIPWPGPQVISDTWTFFDPLTIDIQSSPNTTSIKSIKLDLAVS